MQGEWTEQMERDLRRMWNFEKRTAKEIAKAMGLTRNAIMGKVRRMGLDRRNASKAHNTGRAFPDRAPAPKREVKKPMPKARAPIVPPSDRLDIMELDNSTCRWRLDNFTPKQLREGNRPQFCGRRTSPGSPYCAGHRNLGTVGVKV